MRQLPSGTVTLLFTDIEGSTRLLQELGRERYVEALTIHRRLLRDAFTRQGGVEVDTQGDSFHFAFTSARAAVKAAAAAQRGLAEHDWPSEPIRVRIGVHTGEPVIADDLYAGLDVHRAARVMSAAHGGQVLLSEQTARLLEASDNLALADLGEHRLKDLTQPQRLYQLTGDGLESRFPPPKTLENRPTNLPVQPTPLVGRDHELAQVTALIRKHRLVTLTGPGGAGKTRVALQAAAEVLDGFSDGVWFVNLAPLTDSELVVPTIAQTLALKEQPGEAILETLAAELAGKQLLLLVDNFEHVVDAAAAVSTLLARAARLKVVVTSRAPLRLSGEYEYAVPPLGEDEAVTLFAERAQAVKASFSLNGNRPVIAEICRRLDRLPLAIELAAARIKLLPERALLQRLDEKLKLLAGGARDVDPRQQTLRRAIDWSHDLLTLDEQTLFRRLAVFAGGRTLEAIEEICNRDGQLDVLGNLASLLDKSLLRQEERADAEPRYVMLETIHDYARERLEDSGEADRIEERHAEYYASLVESAEAQLSGSSQPYAMALLDLENDNIRVALKLAARGNAAALRIAGHLAYYWYVRGHIEEALRTLEQAASAVNEAPPALRARLVDSRALFTALRGSAEDSVKLSNTGIAIAREAGDEAALAHSLVIRQMVLGGANDHAGYEAAALEAVQLARQTKDNLTLAASLSNLADAALTEGDYTKARAYGEESLHLFQQLGDPFDTAGVLANLASAALGLGDVGEARALLKRAAQAAKESGSYDRYAWVVDALSALAYAEDAPARAALLAGAYEALVDEHGHPGGAPRPFEASRRARTVASAREALGADRFTSTFERGKQLHPIEALDLGVADRRGGDGVEG